MQPSDRVFVPAGGRMKAWVLSHRTYEFNDFSKVNSPINPST